MFLKNQKKNPPSELCKQIIKYFEDESLTTVIQIVKRIAYSHIDLVISAFKMNEMGYLDRYIDRYMEPVVIQILRKYII